MVREAACQCGQLVLRYSGEPAVVSLCNCLDCQRRTGSTFGVGAFFARERVTVAHGTSTPFKRKGDSGSSITFHFCGVCGSTVWWEPEQVPSIIGVAVGAFADPSFPAPTQATWEKQRHRWLNLPDEVARYSSGVMR
ncbi:GFA family protein [Aureimonas ureilytica]|uniref:GFA family protein n=1 Tax=Aureimonas ureilytica TaxID=401562 RepID=UPI0009EAC99E|nr:GFA family protein [Aureimonas ureilytica]